MKAYGINTGWNFFRPCVSEVAVVDSKESAERLEKEGLTLYYPNPDFPEEAETGLFILMRYHP